MMEATYDEWWASLPETRKAQLYRWITGGGAPAAEPGPGQLALVDVPTA